MARVLVTGATGYIGRRLVAQLVSQVKDIEILTLNRDIAKAEELMPYKECKHRGAKDSEAIKAFKPELVLHLAAYSTSSDESNIIEPLIESNITYGVWLLDVLASLETAKDICFLNVGSFAEYRLGNKELRPAYLYTATKTAFRSFLQYYHDKTGMKVLTAVLYTVYGGKDTHKKLIDYLLDSASAKEPVNITAGEQVLDFIYIDDVIDFFVSVLKEPNDLPDGEYHIGTGKGTSVQALAQMISKEIGKPLNLNWGGRAYRPLDVMLAIAPRQKELVQLWQPKVLLSEGIRRCLRNSQ